MRCRKPAIISAFRKGGDAIFGCIMCILHISPQHLRQHSAGGRLPKARHRLPAIYPFAFYAKQGGLISYGFDASDQFRQGAVYADKILRGAKPADLPVQHPTKFEIVVNLKTAKALGLDVPLQTQQLADEVIE